jgi:hypothetical protein
MHVVVGHCATLLGICVLGLRRAAFHTGYFVLKILPWESERYLRIMFADVCRSTLLQHVLVFVGLQLQPSAILQTSSLVVFVIVGS